MVEVPEFDDTTVRPPPRRTRRVAGRTTLLALGFVAGSLFSGAGAVWASHQFPDVPTSSEFHSDISWLVDNGIAGGYTDGTFRPTAPVSRQAMAAFLHRDNSATVIVNNTVDPGAGTAFSVNVTCPAGKRALAGGGLAFSDALVLQSSSQNGPGNWQARWVSRTGTTIDPALIGVTATCGPT